MKPSQFLELLILAAIWGASFLFMRVAAPEFGATALASYRMVLAALTLLPVLIYYVVKQQWVNSNLAKGNIKPAKYLGHIFVLGIINSAIPMYLFAYAATNLDAGFSSIVNATTPLWGAIIGALLFHTKLSKMAILGLVMGFIGVFVLSFDKLSWSFSGQVKGILAVVAATCLYGLSANYSKRFLVGVKPLFIASGSLFGSAVLMLPILIMTTPNITDISHMAWIMLIALSVISTGIAYILYYRIIEHSGPTNAMTVTFLIPIFGVLFGHLFLAEQLSINILWGALLVLSGVLLTTGLLTKKRINKQQ